MEKDYSLFKLKLGNIADFQGDLIVVPSFSFYWAADKISHSIADKIKSFGEKDRDIFNQIYAENQGKKAELFSAQYFPMAELPNVKGLILAFCYVDRKSEEAEKDMDYYLKTGITVFNVLEKAREINAESIAFPVLGIGRDGGKVDAIAPAMIDEIQRHYELKKEPRNIEVYAHKSRIFDEFMRIADFKLR